MMSNSDLCNKGLVKYSTWIPKSYKNNYGRDVIPHDYEAVLVRFIIRSGNKHQNKDNDQYYPNNLVVVFHLIETNIGTCLDHLYYLNVIDFLEEYENIVLLNNSTACE
jgi:hypothetical protein